MSKEEDKLKHSKRLAQEEAAIQRQIKIARSLSTKDEYELNYEQGRFSKHHAIDSPLNPRKYGNETIQEKRAKQDKVEIE